MINTIIAIADNTPIWVWVVFGVLIVRGIKALSHQTVFIPLLFMPPVIFLGLSYTQFLSTQTWLWYSIPLLIGTLLGVIITHKTKITFLSQSCSALIPGSPAPLILFITFFGVNYFFGYMQATEPEWISQFLFIKSIVAGSFTGFFLGRAIGLFYRWNQEKR